MKKAVVYGRVSTQDQDYGRQEGKGTSIGNWAENNGYNIVQTFAEKHTGASKAYERKEFKNLLQFIKDEDIKMILVDDVARVGRLGGRTRIEIEELAEKGVNMYFFNIAKGTLNDKGKVDYTNMPTIGLLADLAKQEWDGYSYKIKSALRHSARKGNIQGSKFKAYGFYGDPVTKKVMVNEFEFKIVKKIFDMFDKGITTNAITTWLNQNEIPTRYHDFKGQTLRGKTAESYSWTDRTVQRILRNRMWVGERWHVIDGEKDKKELVHKSEPILDVDLFERAQHKLTTRANKRLKVQKNPNYLKDIIKCECGSGMFMNIDPKKGNKTYTCNTRTLAKVAKAEYCGNPSVNIDKLLHTLYTVLTEEFIKKMKGKPSTDFDEKIDVKKLELGNAEKSLKKITGKLESLFEDSLEVDDKGKRILEKSRYLSMNSKLEKEKESLVSTVDELRSEIISLTTAKNNPLKSFYTKEMFLNEAKNIIQLVTAGRASKKDEKQIMKTKQDVGINVDVQTINGQKFAFVLSRYSKNFLFNGEVKPIVNPIMTLNVDELKASLRPKPKVSKYKGTKAAK